MKVVEWGHEVLKMANKAYSLQKTLDKSSGMGSWSTEMANKAYSLQKTLDESSGIGSWSTENGK